MKLNYKAKIVDGKLLIEVALSPLIKISEATEKDVEDVRKAFGIFGRMFKRKRRK